MIRVINQGTLPPLTMIGTCDACGCEVECGQRDAREGKRGQNMQTCWSIDCPTCGNILFVTEKEPIKDVHGVQLREVKSDAGKVVDVEYHGGLPLKEKE